LLSANGSLLTERAGSKIKIDLLRSLVLMLSTPFGITEGTPASRYIEPNAPATLGRFYLPALLM
jgi:hypothetical protein